MKVTPWLASVVAMSAGLNAQPSTGEVIQAQVVATRVSGDAWVTTDQGKRALRDNDTVKTGATVATGEKSSVVLVFSNGTTASLAASSEVKIEQFLQDPFSAEIKLSALAAEPTVSILKLRFVRGELVTKVIKLNHAGGSEMLFDTPAGVAAPRGTVLRMRTTPMSPTTAEFVLEVAEGHVTMVPKGGGPAVFVSAGNRYTATIPWPP